MARLFTPEEETFRREVQEFLSTQLPADIRERMLAGARASRDDKVRWSKI